MKRDYSAIVRVVVFVLLCGVGSLEADCSREEMDLVKSAPSCHLKSKLNASCWGSYEYINLLFDAFNRIEEGCYPKGLMSNKSALKAIFDEPYLDKAKALFAKIDNRLKGDRDIIKSAVNRSGAIYCTLPKRFKNDPALLLIAATNYPAAVSCAPKALRQNSSLEMSLFHLHKIAIAPFLSHLPLKPIIKELEKNATKYCYLPNELQTNPKIYQTALRANHSLYGCCCKNKTKELYAHLSAESFVNLRDVPKSIRVNKSIILNAIRQNPIAMAFADASLRGDYRFAKEAMRIAPMSYLLLTPKLKKKKELLRYALTHAPSLQEHYTNASLKALGVKRSVAYDEYAHGYWFDGGQWLFFDIVDDDSFGWYADYEPYGIRLVEDLSDIDGDGIKDQILTITQNEGEKYESRYIIIDSSKAGSIAFEDGGYQSSGYAYIKGRIRVDNQDSGLWGDGYEYRYKFLPKYNSWFKVKQIYVSPHFEGEYITVRRDYEVHKIAPLWRIDGTIEPRLLLAPKQLCKALKQQNNPWVLNIDREFFKQMMRRFALNDKTVKYYAKIAYYLTIAPGVIGSDADEGIEYLYQQLLSTYPNKAYLYYHYSIFLRGEEHIAKAKRYEQKYVKMMCKKSKKNAIAKRLRHLISKESICH